MEAYGIISIIRQSGAVHLCLSGRGLTSSMLEVMCIRPSTNIGHRILVTWRLITSTWVT